jgi:TRAP-type C4-dicarboxylate transport system permease small subunit|tara:strand:- start:1454 stop:1960 length:507 start_codon:yes stop_codon:yes gene_type:complete
MSDTISNTEAWGGRIARSLSLLGILGFVLLALVTISDVMLRWLFSAPIDGFAEIARLGVAIMSATFLPAALIERYHISIDFLGKWFGPRWHQIFDVFAAFITLGFFTLMGWQFIGYTQELASAGETTWFIGIKVAPYWWVVTGFVIFCIPVQFLVLLRVILRAPEVLE